LTLTISLQAISIHKRAVRAVEIFDPEDPVSLEEICMKSGYGGARKRQGESLLPPDPEWEM
jgi:hypothetical protein